MNEDLIRVGHILAPLGLAGAIKIYVIGHPEALLKLSRLYIERFGWFRIEQSALHGPGVAMNLAGVSSREGVLPLQGCNVYAQQDEYPALPSGEYYYHELRGLFVFSPTGKLIGEVEDVQDAGHHDLLVVRHGKGSSLVPLQAPYVQIQHKQTGQETDGTKGKKEMHIVLDAPAGLLGDEAGES